jgi:hypothetical protein
VGDELRGEHGVRDTPGCLCLHDRIYSAFTSPHLIPLHSTLHNQRAEVKYVSLKFENAPSSPHLSSLDPPSPPFPPFPPSPHPLPSRLYKSPLVTCRHSKLQRKKIIHVTKENVACCYSECPGRPTSHPELYAHPSKENACLPACQKKRKKKNPKRENSEMPPRALRRLPRESPISPCCNAVNYVR